MSFFAKAETLPIGIPDSFNSSFSVATNMMMLAGIFKASANYSSVDRLASRFDFSIRQRCETDTPDFSAKSFCDIFRFSRQSFIALPTSIEVS